MLFLDFFLLPYETHLPFACKPIIKRGTELLFYTAHNLNKLYLYILSIFYLIFYAIPQIWIPLSLPIGSLIQTHCPIFNSSIGIQHLTVLSLPESSKTTYPLELIDLITDLYVLSQLTVFLSTAYLIAFKISSDTYQMLILILSIKYLLIP